jgi:hypothetical protein
MCDCANATINTWTNTQITVTATQVAPNSGVAVGLVSLMGWSNSIAYSPGALEILVPPAVADSNYINNLTPCRQTPSVTGATITVYWSDFDCENTGCTNAGGTSTAIGTGISQIRLLLAEGVWEESTLFSDDQQCRAHGKHLPDIGEVRSF